MKKTGWIMTALFALFMLGASVAPKLLGAESALKPLAELGWPTKYVLLIGCIELVGTLLFILPRTAMLGAVLMTGLIGGAIASHLRVGSPLYSHTLFGIYLALFMWLALWFREPGVRNLLPFSAK
jgi:DoxX-like family